MICTFCGGSDIHAEREEAGVYGNSWQPEGWLYDCNDCGAGAYSTGGGAPEFADPEMTMVSDLLHDLRAQG